jgi:hypothetical protein
LSVDVGLGLVGSSGLLVCCLCGVYVFVCGGSALCHDPPIPHHHCITNDRLKDRVPHPPIDQPPTKTKPTHQPNHPPNTQKAYVAKITEAFHAGLLPLQVGTTLRSYLSDKLNW